MKRRLIAAAAALGALSLALVGGATVAGASTAKPSAAPAVSITASPNANLNSGASVTVTGSGWPDNASVVLVECNADGAGPGDTAGSCNLKGLKPVTTSATGTFSGSISIITGAMTAGKPNNACPQGVKQAEAAVECVIGAADLGTKQFAFAPIHFTAPALSFSFAKASPIDGHATFSMKITESGDYLSTGGFDVIGAFGTASPPSRLCQGSSNGKSTWTPPGLPVCTKFFGEVVQINLNGKKVELLRVDSASTPGDFSWTLPHTPPGTHYTVEAIGLVSGDTLTGTTTVP
jgi:hypothetical protein